MNTNNKWKDKIFSIVLNALLTIHLFDMKLCTVVAKSLKGPGKIAWITSTREFLVNDFWKDDVETS